MLLTGLKKGKTNQAVEQGYADSITALGGRLCDGNEKQNHRCVETLAHVKRLPGGQGYCLALHYCMPHVLDAPSARLTT